MSDKLDGEWLEALEVEDLFEDSKDEPKDEPEDDKPEDDKPDDDKEEVSDDSDDGASEDDAPADEPAEEDETPADSEDNKADKPDEEPAEKPEEPKEPEPVTKETIKEAIEEIEQVKTDRSNSQASYREKVSAALYPEGINRQLKDSDGDPITGIDDLTKLVNPQTSENFTDEEAGAWLLNAQQKLNQDVESVEKFLTEVADVQVEMEDGSKRVATKYEKILTERPQLTDRLLENYKKTLVTDEKTGVPIKAPVSVEEFFDMALEPIMVQEANQAEALAKEAKKENKRVAKAEQSERGDLSPKGTPPNVSEEDKEWAEAMKEYEGEQ